jgi:hypothetical protein
MAAGWWSERWIVRRHFAFSRLRVWLFSLFLFFIQSRIYPQIDAFWLMLLSPFLSLLAAPSSSNIIISYV